MSDPWMNIYPSAIADAFFVDNSTEKMTISDRFNKKYVLQVYNGNVAYHIQQLWKTFQTICV